MILAKRRHEGCTECHAWAEGGPRLYGEAKIQENATCVSNCQAVDLNMSAVLRPQAGLPLWRLKVQVHGGCLSGALIQIHTGMHRMLHALAVVLQRQSC